MGSEGTGGGEGRKGLYACEKGVRRKETEVKRGKTLRIGDRTETGRQADRQTNKLTGRINKRKGYFTNKYSLIVLSSSFLAKTLRCGRVYVSVCQRVDEDVCM